MTQEAQRIAIAEACGWSWWQFKSKDGSHYFSMLIRDSEKWPSSQRFGGVKLVATPADGDSSGVPLYLNDLNAMAEAENTLTFSQCEYYEGRLGDVVKRDVRNGTIPNPPYASWHATAAQRAEAFLKTLNLWEAT